MCWVPALPTALATPCHTPHRVVSYSCCPLSRHNDSFPTVCHRPTSWKTFETPTPRSGAWACPASSPLSWDDSVVGETGEKFLLSEPHALHCSSLKRWSSPPNPAICRIWDGKNFFPSMCWVSTQHWQPHAIPHTLVGCLECCPVSCMYCNMENHTYTKGPWPSRCPHIFRWGQKLGNSGPCKFHSSLHFPTPHAAFEKSIAKSMPPPIWMGTEVWQLRIFLNCLLTTHYKPTRRRRPTAKTMPQYIAMGTTVKQLTPFPNDVHHVQKHNPQAIPQICPRLHTTA